MLLSFNELLPLRSCHAPLTKFTMTYFCESWTRSCLGALGAAVEVRICVKAMPAESRGKRERVVAVAHAF